MQELVIRYFGEAAVPNFGRTPEILLRDPYRLLREELEKSWSVADFTSTDSDLGYMWVIEDHPEVPTVRVSVVGPYALVTNPKGEVFAPVDVGDILQRQGFTLLERELLERPFTFWQPEYQAPLYEFIFEFDEGFPWAR